MFFGGGEQIVRNVNVGAIVRLQQREFYRFRRILFQQVFKEQTVAQRLAHFLSVDLDKPVVNPVFHEFFAGKRLGLRDFVFVMRENKVAAAAVYVNLIAERRAVHCRTFDMPAGTSFAPRAVPRDFAFFCGLPKRKVQRAFLVVFVFDADAGKRFFGFSVAERAVGREFFDGEIHVAFGRCVGVPFFFQPLYEVNDVVDIARRFQPDVGIVHVELTHNFVDAFYHHCRVLVGRDSRFFRFCDNLIVDVGVISGVRYVKAPFHKVLSDDVVNERLICVTDVSVARNGDAARVHIYFVARKRNKFFLSSCQRIVYFNHTFSPLICRFG